MHLVTDEFSVVWEKLLRSLVTRGVRTFPRGIETRELLGVSVRATSGLGNILYHPVRKLNYKFMVAEWLWIMSGVDDLETIAQYNSKMREFSDDGIALNGAYGPRLVHQLSWVLDRLAEQEDTRQAVATIWTPIEPKSKDCPCTVALQFLWREGRINLIVTMRSSDAWLGLPYDFFVFSQILNYICGQHGQERGFVQFNLGSSHLYESDIENALKVIEDFGSGSTIYSSEIHAMPPEELLNILITPSLDGLPMVTTNPWKMYAEVLTSRKEDAIKILTAKLR